MRKKKDGSRTAVACPLAMKLHNESMGGADLADSKRQVYTHMFTQGQEVVASSFFTSSRTLGW